MSPANRRASFPPAPADPERAPARAARRAARPPSEAPRRRRVERGFPAWVRSPENPSGPADPEPGLSRRAAALAATASARPSRHSSARVGSRAGACPRAPARAVQRPAEARALAPERSGAARRSARDRRDDRGSWVELRAGSSSSVCLRTARRPSAATDPRADPAPGADRADSEADPHPCATVVPSAWAPSPPGRPREPPAPDAGPPPPPARGPPALVHCPRSSGPIAGPNPHPALVCAATVRSPRASAPPSPMSPRRSVARRRALLGEAASRRSGAGPAPSGADSSPSRLRRPARGPCAPIPPAPARGARVPPPEAPSLRPRAARATP